MEPVARKHHLNPRFLLSGFTGRGSKSQRTLWEFDARRASPQPRLLKDVAWELDFYSIDVPGERPDFVERLLGKIEDLAAPEIRQVASHHALPTGQRYGNLTMFLALMLIRGPRYRAILKSYEEKKAEMHLQIALATPENWAAVEAGMRADGIPDQEGVTYESMRRLIVQEGFDVTVTNAGPMHTKMIVDTLGWLPRELRRRNWSVLIADADAPDFVTSDNSMTMVWATDHRYIDRPEMGFAAMPPGLAYPGTEVTLPVHRRVALVGTLEETLPVKTVDKVTVMDINARTTDAAVMFVYAAEHDFVYLDHTGRERHAADWLIRRMSQRSAGAVP